MPVNFLKNLFFTAKDEVEAVKNYSPSAQTESPSYELAFRDLDFLLSPKLRPVRLQLELLKPEVMQEEQGVDSTLAIFGSARLHERSVAEALLDEARQALAKSPHNADLARAVSVRENMLASSVYYDHARELGRLLAQYKKQGRCPFVMVSGGGPGIMEAANRGVHDEGGRSVGLKIALPMEDEPNAYVTPELCFQFHYFALRKMHFLMRAKAIVAFPGGFGTLDELFEALTLMQTGKIRHIPLLLFGKAFWNKIVDFEAMVDEGVIAEEDLQLFHMVETADEAMQAILEFYRE